MDQPGIRGSLWIKVVDQPGMEAGCASASVLAACVSIDYTLVAVLDFIPACENQTCVNISQDRFNTITLPHSSIVKCMQTVSHSDTVWLSCTGPSVALRHSVVKLHRA